MVRNYADAFPLYYAIVQLKAFSENHQNTAPLFPISNAKVYR